MALRREGNDKEDNAGGVNLVVAADTPGDDINSIKSYGT